MKSIVNLRTILKMGVVLLATLMYSAGAGAKGPNHPVDGVPYAGYGALCEILEMGTYVEVDGIGMLRGAVMLYRVVTDSPFMTGWHTMTMNYDQHLKSGRGTSWGEGVFQPDTCTGNFTEEYAITARHFVWDIYGTFIGNGELEGILVDYVSTPIEIPNPSPVPEDFCGETPVLGLEVFEGFIHGVE
jgi:hypothetical protein